MVELQGNGGVDDAVETLDDARAKTDSSTLQDLVLKYEEASDFLAELAIMAAERCSSLENQVECGITVVRRRRPSVAAASGARARALDEMQNRIGVGPCLTALQLEKPLLVQDLPGDGRWPEYAISAAAQGVRSVLAIPLSLEGEALAVLNLYSDRAQGFSPADIETVEAFANIAARSLKLALVIARLRESRNDLTEMMRSRTAIDMAIGAIMAQNRCTKSEAFEFLVRASNTRNVKLRDVAASLIRSISGEEEIDTPFDED